MRVGDQRGQVPDIEHELSGGGGYGEAVYRLLSTTMPKLYWISRAITCAKNQSRKGAMPNGIAGSYLPRQREDSRIDGLTTYFLRGGSRCGGDALAA
jgi:hypothetical protein